MHHLARQLGKPVSCTLMPISPTIKEILCRLSRRFKVSMLPWRKLRFTFRGSQVIDCDLPISLQFGRWYHIAATYTSRSNPTVWLNGQRFSKLCNNNV